MLIDPLNTAGYFLGGWHGEWVGPLDVPPPSNRRGLHGAVQKKFFEGEVCRDIVSSEKGG